MAIIQLPLGTGMPDTSGDVYPSTLNAELALSSGSKYNPVMVMEFPTGSDLFVEFPVFTVPQNYAASPALIIKGILDGTPANVLAFSASQVQVQAGSSVDVAYEAEDTQSNSTWTGFSAEDRYSASIALTPSTAYSAGSGIYLKIGRDDSVDTTTFNFLLESVLFQYSDT